MKKKKRKINFSKLLIYELIIGILTSIIISSTYSRYTTTNSSAAEACVAKWSFQTNGFDTMDIVDVSFKNLTDKVADGKIAPGVFGDFSVEIDTTGCEVAVEYLVELFDLENVPQNMKFYSDSQYTHELQQEIDGDSFKYSIKGIMLLPEINQTPVKIINIYWKWNYENESGNDDDTLIGQNPSQVLYKIRVVGVQADPRTKYNITYDSNGGEQISYSQDKIESYDVEIPDITVERTGYDFEGWSTNENATEAEYVAGQTFDNDANTTLYAVWKPKKYQVTYNYATNGGTSTTATTAEIEYGSPVDLSKTATKAGYQFVGWNLSSLSHQPISELTQPANDITLYAIFKKEITATFKYYNNSTTTLTDEMYNNDTYARFTEPQIQNQVGNYNFNGWTLTNTYSAQTVELGNFRLSENKTYYAKYIKNISIGFNSNGGTGNVPETITGTAYMNYLGQETGVTVNMPTNTLRKEDSVFDGWNDNQNGTGNNYTPGTNYEITENKTIYAKWNIVTEPVPYSLYDSTYSIGETYYFVADGSKNTGTLWGTYIYTSDSSVTSAALQLGLLSGSNDSKIIRVKKLAGQSTYNAATMNGITSRSYPSYSSSFVFLDENGDEIIAPNLTISSTATDNSITINTSASVYNGYSVDCCYYKIDSGGYVTDGLSHTFTNVTPYVNHIITVKLKDSAGKESTEKTLTAKTTATIPRPTYQISSNATVLGGVSYYPSGTNVIITYANNMTNISGSYRIVYDDNTNNVAWTSTTNNSAQISLSKSGTIYMKNTDANGYDGETVSVYIQIVQNAPTNMSSYGTYVGNEYIFTVTGTSSGSVWGTDIYTSDSNLGKAAVHAGLVSVGESKILKIKMLAGQSSYTGTTRNGVSTYSYGSYSGSYMFVN